MPQTSEIKQYDDKQAIIDDYDNFRSHWKYDRDQEAGVHDSGIGLSKVFLGDSLKVKYHGYPEWVEDMKHSGLTETQIDDYLRTIKNQFVVICEKEPYVEPQKSAEEVLQEWEERDNRNIERMRTYHHYSEEKLQEIAERFKENREKYVRESGYYGKRSDR